MDASDKMKKKSFKNEDKSSYLCKISYLIKIFVILPNQDLRPKDKSMAKISSTDLK